jgi:hypothetical protein
MVVASRPWRAISTHSMETLLIDGTWRPPKERLTLDVVDPSTGRIFSAIGRGRQEDINDAVNAARSALNGVWGRFTALDRSRVLSRAATLVAEQADLLAELEARETGKPLRVARAEIDMAVRYFEFYGGAADKAGDHVIPYIAGHNAVATREPLGDRAHRSVELPRGHVWPLDCTSTRRRQCRSAQARRRCLPDDTEARADSAGRRIAGGRAERRHRYRRRSRCRACRIGYGREKGLAALDEMSAIKTVVHRYA